MRICLYCASSAAIDKSSCEATDRLARETLEESIEVVCGVGRAFGA